MHFPEKLKFSADLYLTRLYVKFTCPACVVNTSPIRHEEAQINNYKKILKIQKFF